MPAAASSFLRTRSSGAPAPRSCRRNFRPNDISVVRCEDDEPERGREQVVPCASVPEWDLATVAARQPGLMQPGYVEGDLGPRVSSADDENGALPQLGGPPVVGGGQLDDARIERGGEGGHAGSLVGTRRHDHVVGLEPPIAGDEEVPAPGPAQSVDVDTGPNGKVEPCGVRLEVVGHLILRRVRPAACRERPTGKPRVPSRREQAKRIPAAPPGVSDPIARVQDHEWAITSRKVVTGRKTCLTASDDHGLETLRARGVVASRPQLTFAGFDRGHCRRPAARPRSCTAVSMNPGTADLLWSRLLTPRLLSCRVGHESLPERMSPTGTSSIGRTTYLATDLEGARAPRRRRLLHGSADRAWRGCSRRDALRSGD